jgi:hypothetical protein
MSKGEKSNRKIDSKVNKRRRKQKQRESSTRDLKLKRDSKSSMRKGKLILLKSKGQRKLRGKKKNSTNEGPSKKPKTNRGYIN